MLRLRLCFEKTGRAVYLSHLDLMRNFQRAFSRTGMKVHHTEGYNPRLYLSIVQPLSLGFAGERELLDVQWEDGDYQKLPELLNAVLPEGIRVHSCQEALSPVRQVALAKYVQILSYDHGDAMTKLPYIKSVYDQDALVVLRKTKRGEQESDIRPQIYEIALSCMDEKHILLESTLAAGGVVLNPIYLIRALPENLRPDYTATTRKGLYKEDFTEFW